MTDKIDDLIDAIWALQPTTEQAHRLTSLAQAIFSLNAPQYFAGKMRNEGLRGLTDAVLKQVANPHKLAGLFSDEDTRNEQTRLRDLHLARWELHRREWLALPEPRPRWDLDYKPYLYEGQKPYGPRKVGEVDG